MKLAEKILLLQDLNLDKNLNIEKLYAILGRIDAIKKNYYEFMTTSPIDCEKELLRLSEADYDFCCALITMMLREDHFNNGMLELRYQNGQVHAIIDRMIKLLSSSVSTPRKSFSQKALMALGEYYVYALIDPRDDKVFYVGKGTENRIFSHEMENGKNRKSEKSKLKKIQEIENDGLNVKRLIVNWGLTESEAYAAEATLINLLNYVSDIKLTNIVAGHHVHESLTTEEFELMYGAVPLKPEEVKHNILVIKINKLYRKNMTDDELYDIVRGMWNASLKSIKDKKVKYVFGVYNGLIVAVYKPDEWHYVYENINVPQRALVTDEEYEKLKNRVYFICNDHTQLDEEGAFYLHKSIVELKINQASQNPISYLLPY